MSKTMTITRIDLPSKGDKVNITFLQTGINAGEPVETDNKIVIHKKPHDDLANAFLAMVPHILWISQLSPIKSVDDTYFNNFGFQDDEEFKGVNVTSIIISGKDLDFVQLIGTKTTDKLEVVSISCPKVWLDDESTKAYQYASTLREQKETLLSEAVAFYKGKYKPSDQGELEFATS